MDVDSTGFTDAEPVTAIGATDIQDFSTRTADSANLNEGGKCRRRLESAWCTGQCAGSRQREAGLDERTTYIYI